MRLPIYPAEVLEVVNWEYLNAFDHADALNIHGYPDESYAYHESEDEDLQNVLVVKLGREWGNEGYDLAYHIGTIVDGNPNHSITLVCRYNGNEVGRITLTDGIEYEDEVPMPLWNELEIRTSNNSRNTTLVFWVCAFTEPIGGLPTRRLLTGVGL